MFAQGVLEWVPQQFIVFLPSKSSGDSMNITSRGLVFLFLVAFVTNGFAQVPPFLVGANFGGSTRTQSGFIPPDTMGAIGPNHYVELINGRFSRFGRTGIQQEASSLNAFWNTALTAGGGGAVQGSFAFDPRIMYDRHSGRWFSTAVDSAANANSGILIGVTSGNDPSAGNWRAFRVDADANNFRWADYPTMGINGNWVTVTNNMFGVSGSGASTSVSVLSIPKSSLTAAAPSIAGNQYVIDTVANPGTPLINSHGFTLHPTYDYSNSFSNTAYLVSRFNNTNLQVSTLTGSVSNPTLTGNRFVVTANRAMGNINAPQLGANDDIDAGDNRMSGNPVIVNGKIWGVHAFDGGGRAQSVVFRIDAATNALEYEGVVTLQDTDLWSYNPSIAVNELGQIAVAFSGSDNTSFIGSYAIAGLFDGSTVTWGTEQLLRAGLGNYSALDGAGRNRWGDYSAVQVDPNDPTRFWTIQEFASGTNQWQTQVTELIWAIPEPGSAILLIGGLLSLTMIRRRK